MTPPLAIAARLADIVFPGDTNHHGTLFGGAALAAMDRFAFIAATRLVRADFVTASCERIDFRAPGRLGDILDLSGRIVRLGRRSLAVEVDLVAEAALTGERRSCCRGVFNMVATAPGIDLAAVAPAAPADGEAPFVDLVMPAQTSHLGWLYGGGVLAGMAKAAFIAATRHCRRTVVLAGSERTDFAAPIAAGDIIELRPRLVAIGRTSMTVEVAVRADSASGARDCGAGTFRMVAVDERHRPVPVAAAGISPPAKYAR